jgi:DNA-binding transcriptional ArsR family regulator
MLNYTMDMDRVFHSLADKTRRGIIEQLSAGPASVKTVAQPHDMSLPAVMLHLQILEQSGLIQTRKEGRVRLCTLTPEPIVEAADWIQQRKAQWNSMFDTFEMVVTEPRELGR